MKKTIFLAVLAASLALLSGCGKKNQEQNQNQVQNQSQNQQTQVQQEQAKSETGNQDGTISGSIQDIIKMGKSVKCEVAFNEENFQGKNTTYVSGESARSDIAVDMAGRGQHNSHMIVKDGWTYMWSDGSSKGTKFDTNEFKKNVSSENQGVAGPPSAGDISQKMDFKCSPWTADDSLLTLPSGVEFADETQTMNQMPGGNPGMPNGEAAGNGAPGMPKDLQAQQCASCERNPNQATIDQCKKVFKCAELE
jgi:hypothetical protein